jgi:hypothetical protein
MAITMPDCSDHRPVTERPDVSPEKLNRTVYDAPGRPCADPGADPEQWFPREPGSGRRTRARANYEAMARQLCHGCPVQPACLELSIWLEGPDRGHGISGGTAPWQRQAIKAGRGMAVRRD